MNTLSRTAIHNGDRQLGRTSLRFGEEFREIRLRVAVSQAAVARSAGVARSVICRIELGDPDVSPRIRARAAAALGADFRISIYPEATPLIHDAAHARLVEAVLKLMHGGGHVTVEAPIPGPGRRSSDIRLDRGLDIVLLEIETRVRALEAIIRECAEKRASVAEASDLGRRVHVVLVLPATRHHRALASAHPRIVLRRSRRLPMQSRVPFATLMGRGPGDGILWLPQARATAHPG